MVYTIADDLAHVPVCHGLGEAYTVSMEELEARRQKALESYPDDGVPNWRPNAGQLISGHSPQLRQGTGTVFLRSSHPLLHLDETGPGD